MISLSRAQYNFINSTTKGTMFLSCIAGGKSYALVFKSIIDALAGKRVLVLSYSLNNLRDNLVPLYRQVLDLMGYTEGAHYYITKSPSINVVINRIDIMLRTASNPDSLRGPSVAALYFDEARELTREAFDIGLGRLRAGSDLQWFIATTVRGKDWVYDIIKEEGLTDIFNTNMLANNYLTLIRTTIDEVPHISEDYVNDLKRQYTSSFAQQELYCAIVDGAAEIINPDWLILKDLASPKTGIRFWDLAVSTKTSADYSAGCLMTKLDKYYIHDIKRVKLAYPDLKKLIIQTAIQDGPDVHIGLEDAGQQLAIIQDLRRVPELSNHVLRRYRPTKDKITRALPFASQCELSNVIINNMPFVRFFKDECLNFNSKDINKGHNDMIDATTGAYNLLCTGIATTNQLG